MEKSNSQFQKGLPNSLNANGQMRSTWTSVCKFKKEKIVPPFKEQVTYRSDINLVNQQNKGFKGGELTALVYKVKSLMTKSLLMEAKIFDNRKPAEEALLYHYDGEFDTVFINKIIL